MLTYSFKYKKDTESFDSKILKTKHCRTILLWKCAVSGSEISRFVKKQEARGLLSSLGLKTTLRKATPFGDILF